MQYFNRATTYSDVISLSGTDAGAGWKPSCVRAVTTDWSYPLMRSIHTGAASTFCCSQFRNSNSPGLTPHHSRTLEKSASGALNSREADLARTLPRICNKRQTRRKAFSSPLRGTFLLPPNMRTSEEMVSHDSMSTH